MNLEDQLRGDQSGAGSARLTERIQVDEVEADSAPRGRTPRVAASSIPYGELKTRVQRAVHREARAVAVLEPGVSPTCVARSPSRSPRSSTRRARRSPQVDRERLIEEITADILGYGPIERFLADDTVTEVMVNGFDRVYVERNGKIEATDASFVDDEHLAADHRQDRLPGRPPRRRERRRWSMPACPTAAASTRSSRRSRSAGRR